MKRVYGHLLAGAAVLACAATLTPACVHDNSTIFVYDVLGPQLVAPGQTCTFTNDPTQPSIPRGTMDTALLLSKSYAPVYLVANQMVPQVNPQTPTTETSYVTIQGAVVRITDAAGVQIRTFTSPAAEPLAPLNGTIPSFTAISVVTIDPQTLAVPEVAQGIAPGSFITLLTYVRFFGQTTGGESVETGEFEFPVDVCTGCLITFSASDINACFVQPNCLAAAQNAGAGSGGTNTVPCPVIGQDLSVDCSQCLGNPACNPTVPPITGCGLDAGPG